VSELISDWRFTANQFILATSPLRLTTSNFIFQLNTCGYSPYETSSLARGWVRRLQLLLALVSAVIPESESRGTQDYILLSQIRDSPTWRVRSTHWYPPGTGWPGYTPRHWVPFSSLSTTRRVTVEVLTPPPQEILKIQFLSWGHNRCLLWEPYGTRRYTVWEECRVSVC
jgi:hypothetical protein